MSNGTPARSSAAVMYQIQAHHAAAARLLIAACEIADAFTVMSTIGIRADVVATALDALADLEGAFALLEAPEAEVVDMVVDLWIRVHRVAALPSLTKPSGLAAHLFWREGLFSSGCN